MYRGYNILCGDCHKLTINSRARPRDSVDIVWVRSHQFMSTNIYSTYEKLCDAYIRAYIYVPSLITWKLLNEPLYRVRVVSRRNISYTWMRQWRFTDYPSVIITFWLVTISPGKTVIVILWDIFFYIIEHLIIVKLLNCLLNIPGLL